MLRAFEFVCLLITCLTGVVLGQILHDVPQAQMGVIVCFIITIASTACGVSAIWAQNGRK
jgi:hypothetical protein